jgi:hypothetical protein
MLEIIGLRRIRDFSHGSFRNRHNRVNRLQEDHRLVRSVQLLIVGRVVVTDEIHAMQGEVKILLPHDRQNGLRGRCKKK